MDTTTAIVQGEQALNMAPKLVDKIQSIMDSSFKYSSLQAIERYVSCVIHAYAAYCCQIRPSRHGRISFPQLDANTDSEAVV